MARFFLHLLLAPEADAAAIHALAKSNLREIPGWPHLPVPGVDGPDFNKMEKLARPKRLKGSTRIGGVLLVRSKLTSEPITAVSRVSPEFVEAMAGMDDAAAAAWATAWSGELESPYAYNALSTTKQLIAFARQAIETGVPMLELVVM